MKYYRLEPATKKSVVETEHFQREDGLRLSVEVGWRWGEFKLSIPDTEEEILEFLQERGGYDTIQEWMADYFGDEDIITEDTPLETYLLPNPEEDDTVELEDYEFEMLSTWDGCWEDYNVYAPYGKEVEFTEEEEDAILEALSEEGSSGLWDEWEEDHPLHGWESVDCTYVIYNGFTLEECDENGTPLKEQE